MSDLIASVKARFAAEPATEAPLWAHWNAVCDKIEAHAKAQRPKMRSFEVHHMSEVARKNLLQAFADRKPDAELETIALKAIGLGGDQ